MGTDKERLRKIRNGDIKEFETLFRSSYISLTNYALAILKDKDAAEEIVQDLFYRIWRDKNKINITTSINGYLFRSVYNRCIHYIEHKKVVLKHARGNEPLTSSYSETPEEIMRYRELNEKIADIIEKLPGRCAQIFCMSRFEGLKYTEIADKLAISVKTVESNIGKALREFRKELL
jgi:RNA polymerase sigma-70 factor, ECF subfamily